MKEHSEIAWNIASRYSRVLASETRDLAAQIDAAIAAEVSRLHGSLQEMVDMVAPTLKSEHRLSQGLSSALIRARQELKRYPVASQAAQSTAPEGTAGERICKTQVKGRSA